MHDFVIPEADVHCFAPDAIVPGETKKKIRLDVVDDLVTCVLFCDQVNLEACCVLERGTPEQSNGQRWSSHAQYPKKWACAEKCSGVR